MRLVIRLLASAAALAVATWLLPGISLSGDSLGRKIGVMLLVALIFGIANAIVKPIFTLFTAPLVLLTLGLFLLVINALMMMLTSWISGLFDLGWIVDGFWWALLGALIVSVASWLLNTFLGRDRRPERA